MSSISPPGLWITPASPTVLEQMGRLNNHADRMVSRTEGVVNEILSLTFSNADLDPQFQFSQSDLDSMMDRLGPLPDAELTDWLGGLDLSAGDENFVFNAQLLDRMKERFPELVIPVAPAPPPAPVAPGDPGDPAEIPPPQRPSLEQYDAPDIDTDIPMPQYADMTAEVPFPDLREIVLPPVPELELDNITFQGVAPVFDGTPPDPADFQFEAQVYEPTFMEDLEKTISSILNGGSGLPPDVEYALFERAREREVEVGEREVDQVTNEWAARGHRYPPGPHARRVDLTRKEVSYKVSQLNRDQFIEHWRIQLEQLRTALTTALAAEDSLMRMFSDGEDRRLQAMQFKLSLAIEVFNAYVSKYTADATVFQTQATVYRERIQAEVAKMQVYTAKLQGLQLIGELNQQEVQIFAERMRALQINADIYRTRVEAYSAQHDALRTKVSLYRAQLESNKELLSVYETDTRAFVEMIRAQQVREERFNTKASIYGRQIEAWKTRYEGDLAGFNAQIEQARMIRDGYVADSERLGVWVQGEQGRVRALSDKYQAMATEISARSEVERTRVTLGIELARAAVERYKAALDSLLKNAEINIQSGLAASSLLLRARETGATTYAQLAAGFTSAASINAGISDHSQSSLSYNLSGELSVN